MGAGRWWEWRRGWDSNPRCSSHTAFRERHLKPLGHLSAAESSRGWTDPRHAGRALRRWPAPRLPAASLRLAHAGDHGQLVRQGLAAGQLDGAAGRPALLVRHGIDQAKTSVSTSAPTHMAHGSWVVKIVTSDSRRDSSLRAVPCRVSTAWAVGSRCSRVRSWSRAIMASSRTATAPTGSLFSSPASLGDGLGHEELVVHRSSDDT